MSVQIFTSAEQEAVEALALRRGFTELRGYIYACINQDAFGHGFTMPICPTLDELMTMSPEERTPYLEASAAIAEPLYRNDPELTATSETIDLFDYPDD